VIWAIET